MKAGKLFPMVDEHALLMQADLAVKAMRGIKTQTRRLDLTWMKVNKGDRIWVRETWATEKRYDAIAPRDLPRTAPIWFTRGINRKRDGLVRGKWRPSIFLPKWASRLKLEATADARMERLQKITEEDARAEGAETMTLEGMEDLGNTWGDYKTGFKALWDRINGEHHPWKSNPDVVVLNFKRLKK